MRLTVNGQSDLLPSWSPDGHRIAFQSSLAGGYEIWTMLADATDPRQVTANPTDDESPDW